MPNPFSPENTLKHLPTNQANVGIVAEGSDIGVTGSVQNDFGKPGGWSVAAAGEWFKDRGKRAAIWLNWQKK